MSPLLYTIQDCSVYRECWKLNVYIAQEGWMSNGATAQITKCSHFIHNHTIIMTASLLGPFDPCKVVWKHQYRCKQELLYISHYYSACGQALYMCMVLKQAWTPHLILQQFHSFCSERFSINIRLSGGDGYMLETATDAPSTPSGQ